MGVKWLADGGTYGGFVPVAPCTSTVIDRDLFHHLGGYDESLPLYGAAEPEFSVRAWLSGYEIVNVPDLLIQHRFRSQSNRDKFYAANRSVILPNYLRFACYYLGEELLCKAYNYFSKLMGDSFDSFMAQHEAADMWIRRAELKRHLPFHFEWLVDRFGLAAITEKPGLWRPLLVGSLLVSPTTVAKDTFAALSIVFYHSPILGFVL
jgi:hypothetical protein